MLLTVCQLVLFCVPLSLGHVMDAANTNRHELGKKSFIHKGITKRSLQPTLSIRKAPQEITEIMSGESTYLECEAGGTPPPTIQWLKDGKRISQDKYEVRHHSGSYRNMKLTSLGLGFTRSRFYLDCISPSDAGRYTCVAENEFIQAFKSTQVYVTEALAADDKDLCLAKKTFGSPAHITMFTRTRLELMGSDVTLYCRAHGRPQPHIKWIGPNQEELTDPKKYEVLPDGNLIIRKLQWSDMGGYICKASNSEGSDEVLAFLYPTMPEEEDSDV